MAREMHTPESAERGDVVCRREHRVSFLASSNGSDHTRAQNVRCCLLIATCTETDSQPPHDELDEPVVVDGTAVHRVDGADAPLPG